MSSTSFDMPEEMASSGGYLEVEGTFHVLITEVKVGQGPKGNAMAGNTFGVHILAGNVEGQSGKMSNLLIREPKLTAVDGGAFGRRIVAAFLIASDLASPAQLGKTIEFEVENAKDRQLVVKFKFQDRDGKKQLDIAGDHIFHVDDPRVAKIPKDAEALAMLDAKFRHKEDWFAPLLKKKEPAGAGAGGGAAKGAAPDLSDL